jgi:hypothetical protein
MKDKQASVKRDEATALPAKGPPRALRSWGEQRYDVAGLRDWSILVISIAFTAAGFIALFDKPRVGVPTLALFGACAALAARTVLRKRRFARLRLISVEIVGGVPIRPSRGYLIVVALALSSLGTVLLVYWRGAPLAVLISAWITAGVGALLLLGLVTGHLPVGFLQFDPAGLTIGRRRDAFTIPWASIAAVSPGEFHDNPVLFLSLQDASRVIVTPPQARGRVIASLISNTKWVGAHVMIMSSHYAIDLPFLVTAIERYIADPHARDGLAVPRLAPREEQ